MAPGPAPGPPSLSLALRSLVSHDVDARVDPRAPGSPSNIMACSDWPRGPARLRPTRRLQSSDQHGDDSDGVSETSYPCVPLLPSLPVTRPVDYCKVCHCREQDSEDRGWTLGIQLNPKATTLKRLRATRRHTGLCESRARSACGQWTVVCPWWRSARAVRAIKATRVGCGGPGGSHRGR